MNLIKENFVVLLPSSVFSWIQGEVSSLNSISNHAIQMASLAEFTLKADSVEIPTQVYEMYVLNFTIVEHHIRPAFDENVVFIGNGIIPLHAYGTHTKIIMSINVTPPNGGEDFHYSPVTVKICIPFREPGQMIDFHQCALPIQNATIYRNS